MFWNSKKRAQKIDTIAETAYRSSQPGNGGVALSFHAMTPMIRDFFRKYGTTDHSYKAYTEPRRMWAGYISYNGSEEFIALIILGFEGIVVYGFQPPEEYQQDMASLLKKKVFFDEVVASVQDSLSG